MAEVEASIRNTKEESNQSHTSSPLVKQVVLSSTFATGLFFTTPFISEAALGDQTLTEGMTHPDVKELQEVLKAKGHFNYHTATGYYGQVTTQAVASFQKAQGLPQNGQATRATLDQLLSIAESTAQKTSSSPSGVLKQGTTSSQVMELQKQLKRAGHFHQDPTGYYGRVTTEAVRSFQRANQLGVDGVAGPQTLNALQNSTAVTISSTTKPSSSQPAQAQTTQTLRIGAKGQAVERLQQRLLDLGFYKGAVDGDFGQGTDAAVRRMQAQERIGVDGIVGPQTWNVLSTASAAAVQKPQGKPNTPAPAPAVSATSALKIGAQGANVTNVQAQLRAIGLFAQEPTGYYGTITEQAVKAFQRQQGLSVDGVAGSKTLSLLSQLAGAPQTSQASSTGGFSAMNLVADSSELLGIPYVWGGSNTSCFDCSGFISYVFTKNGIQLPRTVAGMWSKGTQVSSPRVGDLVFFETFASGPTHAGIYIGNNQFVHSGTSTGVTTASLGTSYWKDRYLGAKRVF